MWKLSKIKSNYNKKKNIDLKSSVDKTVVDEPCEVREYFDYDKYNKKHTF